MGNTMFPMASVYNTKTCYNMFNKPLIRHTSGSDFVHTHAFQFWWTKYPYVSHYF